MGRATRMASCAPHAAGQARAPVATGTGEIACPTEQRGLRRGRMERDETLAKQAGSHSSGGATKLAAGSPRLCSLGLERREAPADCSPGWSRGGTLGRVHTNQGAPRKGRRKPASVPSPLQGLNVARPLPRVPPSAPPWATIQRRFAAWRPALPARKSSHAKKNLCGCNTVLSRAVARRGRRTSVLPQQIRLRRRRREIGGRCSGR